MSVESPCVGICSIDGESGLCRGCCRTLDEIRAWKSASDDEKLAILAAAGRRTPPDDL